MVSVELRSNVSDRSQRSAAHGPRQRAARRLDLGSSRSVGDGLGRRRRTPAPHSDSAARRRRHRRAPSPAVHRPLCADRRPAADHSPRRMESVLRGAYRRRAVSQSRAAYRFGAERSRRLSVQHVADAQRRQAEISVRRQRVQQLWNAQCAGASPPVRHLVHKVCQHGSLRARPLVLQRPRTAQRIHVHWLLLLRLRQDGVLSNAYRFVTNNYIHFGCESKTRQEAKLSLG